jgi:DegV family protein with EDD domain
MHHHPRIEEELEMKKGILVITGDNLGLANDQIDYPSLEIVKYPVIIGGKEHKETDGINALWLIERFREDKVVAKSASIVKGDLVEIVKKNKDKYGLIVHVVMSSILSNATFAVTEDVKKMFQDDVQILNIDSRQATCGVGAVLLRVIDLLAETKDPQTIIERSKSIVENTFSLFVIPDLSYLQRGGRIGKARALMGSLLKIIPLVGIMGEDPNAQIIPLGKGRTYAQVNATVTDIILKKMKEKGVDRVKLVNVIELDADRSALDDLMDKLENSFSCDRVVRGTPRLVEAVHLGPSSYGISFSLA